MAARGPLLNHSTPDQSILTNLVFCVTIFVPLFIVFGVARILFKPVYAPNVINTKRKTANLVPTGFFSWISASMKMSDDELLSWIGLDGFVFLQTIKLIFGILVMLAVPAILILCPVYYLGNGEAQGQWFIMLSISHVSSPAMLWFATAFNYYTAIIVFYGLYIFYRNLTIYRQTFLRNPDSCVAQVSMRRLAKNLGSLENVRKIVNVSSRTAVITNVSSKYSKSEIISMFADMGIEDINAVVIIQSRKKVRKMLMQRNKILEQLESELQTFYDALADNMAMDREQSRIELESSYAELARIGSAERKELMKKLLDERLFAEFRPKTKVSGEEVDAISYRYKSLIKRDDELLEAAKRFSMDNERYVLDMDSSYYEDEPSTPSTESDLLVNQKTLVSWRQFFAFKGNVKDYGLTMWGTSMSIIVLFGSQRSAIVAEQTLLSRRPFSMEVTPAPAADDIIWDNLYCPQGERFTRRLIGSILYVMVNILFTSADILISPLLSPKTLKEYSPLLNRLLTDYPKLNDVLAGILAPLFYNIFLLVAPYMLYGLSIFQGRTSKTSVQESLLEKYTWLLFLQSFVVFLLSSALFTVLEQIITGQYGEIISQLRSHMPEHAAFFLNVILQRAAISLMFVLLKPSGLFLQLVRWIIWRRSLRKRALYWEPDRVFMGALYPVHVIFIFMVTMSFIPLTPIISLAGLIFYGFAYLVFRYHFIFNYEIPHESGGEYWMFLPTPILVGCILGQIFSIIQISFLKGTIQALCMAPLCIVTVCSIVFLRNVFQRRSKYLPLGGEASDRVESLSGQMREKQEQMIRKISREAGEDMHFSGETSEAQQFVGAKTPMSDHFYETVPYDFGEQESRLFTTVEDSQFGETAAAENPYCNPIMFKRYPFIMVPPYFFHILKDCNRP